MQPYCRTTTDFDTKDVVPFQAILLRLKEILVCVGFSFMNVSFHQGATWSNR